MQKYINVEPIPLATVYDGGVRTDRRQSTVTSIDFDIKPGSPPHPPSTARMESDSFNQGDEGRSRGYVPPQDEAAGGGDGSGLSNSPQFGSYRKKIERPAISGIPDDMLAPLQTIANAGAQGIAGAQGLRRSKS
mmetsp:Transcript_6678/g.6913  ORF Transcript_6678/g.6913 Transcript_6678/m.6913 type:complete len:134 (-) Transcript_6678:246-647(-)